MGDALRSFDGKAKARGDLFFPVLDHARLRQTIERVVDFNRRQTLRIIRKHLFRRQIFRVEITLPLLVAVAAGADVKFHSYLRDRARDQESGAGSEAAN